MRARSSTRTRYVWADLVRNRRRTFSTMIGVTLGVGLSCSVLFFVDGLSASMTQRAVAPVAIDMQQVATVPIGGDLRLQQEVLPAHAVQRGELVRVRLVLRNQGIVRANEVVVRSELPAGMAFVAGSARLDGKLAGTGNPFANGAAQAGRNLGTVDAGSTRILEYQARATATVDEPAKLFFSTASSREALIPVRADTTASLNLTQLTSDIARRNGVAFADELSFADLPSGSLSSLGGTVSAPVRVFGFDPSYAARYPTIRITQGRQVPGEALLSIEAAATLKAKVGDVVSVALPDRTAANVSISGIADLTRARPLFISRQGADFETFHYVRTAVVLDSATFDRMLMPAYNRAASTRGELVKSPPTREIDIGVKRSLLNADPGTALGQTNQIAARVRAVAHHQGFLLDNISNTLTVARNDAGVAKQLFAFLGIPAILLAALLSMYAGTVLAGAQRREQAILRARGASRSDLRWMLALRIGGITAAGAVIGVALGYASATIVLGRTTLARASTQSLLVSGLLGTAVGLAAVGASLYITGRRAIDTEIDVENSPLTKRPPMWRRYRLDIVGVIAVAAATAVAIATSAFNGTPGSIYVGRSVKLSLGLLFLPIAAWIAGSLLLSRGFARILRPRGTYATVEIDRVLPFLYRMSIRRRSWAVAEAAVVVGMIVALATSLAVFTASYDGAKVADARYVVGSDIRIVPSPANEHNFRASDRAKFKVAGVQAVAPVVYGISNVVIHSKRTSDPMNLAAVDPRAYQQVAPIKDSQFLTTSAASSINLLVKHPDSVLMSATKADFLQAEVGDTLLVLLARGSSQQVETKLKLVGLYEQLPGFPDGVDALMNIAQHEAVLPSTTPDFFLAKTVDGSNATLNQAVANLGHVTTDGARVAVETRATALAVDQSSLAALNLRGLVNLDSGYALAMGTVAIAIFVFGLLLQRRREYVTLRAQGVQPAAIRSVISAEAGTVAIAGCITGVIVGSVMAFYVINVLHPLFLLTPRYRFPLGSTAIIVASVLLASAVTSLVGSTLVNRLRATELLRDQ